RRCVERGGFQTLVSIVVATMLTLLPPELSKAQETPAPSVEEQIRQLTTGTDEERQGAESALSKLIAALKAAPDDETRGRIAVALGDLGEKAAPAVEPLNAALKATQDGVSRFMITLALLEIREREPSAESLIALLKAAPDNKARAQIAYYL